MCRALLWKCSHRFNISVVSIEVAVDTTSFGSVGLLCGNIGLFYGYIGLFLHISVVKIGVAVDAKSLGSVGLFCGYAVLFYGNVFGKCRGFFCTYQRCR